MCQYPGCQVPAEPGEKLCILHLASQKDVERFKEALYRQLDEKDRCNASSKGRYNFVGYHFPCSITATELTRDEFQGVILPKVINDKINFSHATINGNAEFAYATIAGEANFFDATINGIADFLFAKINGEANFCDTRIKGNARFIQAEIDGEVNFNRATINGIADFYRAKINGEANFCDTRIKGNARFIQAEIDGDVDFTDVQIEGNAWFSHATITCNVDFSGAWIKRAAFFDNVTIAGQVQFAACSAGSIYLGEDRPQVQGWRLGVDRCGIAIRDVRASSFWKFAQLTFSKNGERTAADAAFYLERVCRLKAQRTTKAREGTRLQGVRTAGLRIFYWGRWALDCLLLRWTTAYGASIARLFTTWFVVLGGFGVAFSLTPQLIQRSGADVWTLRNWIVGFHYSVTTFTTLGLGQIGPGSSRLSMILTSIEALLGALLIALAVLVIGRRFMR